MCGVWGLMTTVAVSTLHKSIACDLQGTYKGSTKFKMKTKIITLNPEVALNLFGVDGAYVGFAGSLDIWAEVIGWLMNPTTKAPKCGNNEFLMLTSKNEIYHATNMRNWGLMHDKSFAIGTGGSFAVAAMSAGKTPKEAVQIACKHDIYSGGGVKVFSFD